MSKLGIRQRLRNIVQLQQTAVHLAAVLAGTVRSGRRFGSPAPRPGLPDLAAGACAAGFSAWAAVAVRVAFTRLLSGRLLLLVALSYKHPVHLNCRSAASGCKGHHLTKLRALTLLHARHVKHAGQIKTKSGGSHWWLVTGHAIMHVVSQVTMDDGAAALWQAGQMQVHATGAGAGD